MKTLIAVLGIVLMNGIAVRADDQTAKAGLLLLELEQSIKIPWQNPSWPQNRVAWRSKVEGAPDAEALGKLVAELEESLKPEAFDAEWSANAHRGWKFACGLVRNLPSLGQLVVALEKQIKSEAQDASWIERRPGWVTEMNALVRTTHGEMINEASKAAFLLLELERATKSSWQETSWATERDTWIERVKNVPGPLTLTYEILGFERSLKRDALDDEWLARRSDTSVSLFSAGNLAECGAVMIRLERHIKSEAQEDAWMNRRQQWALEAQAL